MSPRFVLGRENVPCVAEVVNRSLKADCTDFTDFTDFTWRASDLDNLLSRNIRSSEISILYLDNLHVLKD